MADKYIIHGATFNGDGTSSASATSNGGVGAWNNINIFQGTSPAYGTLAAGDRVFVRTKDAAGADITVNTATAMNLGSAAATETAPITWIFDAGAVWPGVSGTVTFNATASVVLTVRDWNNLVSKNYNCVLSNSLSTTGVIGAVTLGTGFSEDLKIDLSACTGTGSAPWVAYKTSVHSRPWVVSAGRYQALFKTVTSRQNITLYNPEIELVQASELDAVFDLANTHGAAPVSVFGGRVFGVGAVNGAPLVRLTAGSFFGSFASYGLEYPREMPLSDQASFGDTSRASADGSDGGYGSEYFDYYYTYTSRSDNYPPTLNAYYKLTGGATQYWSYRLYPYRTSQSNPARITVQKTWRQAAAAQTITQELLWPDGMAAPTKDQVYIVVQYTDDATGLPKTLNSRDPAGGTLDASTAAWSATTWGMVNLGKRKLSVTTPTSIKQDTAVLVTLFVASRSATANDVMFVCPDPVFSTP